MIFSLCNALGRFPFLPGLKSDLCWTYTSARFLATTANATLTQWLSRSGGNIILLGPPGAGKTSVGGRLAEVLDLSHLDVDNDHLEKLWRCPVADKLAQVGGERFLEEEGIASLQLSTDIRHSVISLSGSNPMHTAAMKHICQLGVLVYLDVDPSDILKRLEAMKVNRIVGQTEGASMVDILERRGKFYESWYQVRAVIPSGSGVDDCDDIITKTLEHHVGLQDGYVSTRAGPGSKPADLEQVVLQGLAADGGLYVPRFKPPQLSSGQWQRLVPLSFKERAIRILEQWLPHTVSRFKLREILNRAYSSFEHEAVAPIVPVNTPSHLSSGRRLFLQELFWGPTASFKDLALQVMPQILELLAEEQKIAILVATSGDTGSAAVDGFARHTDIPVAVLYPTHGVSRRQQQQLCVLAGQVFPGNLAIGVDADFDFCQASVKEMFNNESWCNDVKLASDFTFNSANSINWMRLLPQVIHHASGYLDLVAGGHIAFGEAVDVAIPTGNFGNMMSAIYAKRMGVPFGKFIVACNSNNVLEDFLSYGTYDLRNRALVQTMSPSMDILRSSNVERLLHLLACDLRHPTPSATPKKAFVDLRDHGFFEVAPDIQHLLSNMFLTSSTSEQECQEEIRNVYRETRYILDPHTAVAMRCFHGDKAAGKVSNPNPVIIASTAHWEKFPEQVTKAISEDSSRLRSSAKYKSHVNLAKCLELFSPELVTVQEASQEKLETALHSWSVRHADV